MTDSPDLRPILILLTDGFADWETGLIAANLPEIKQLGVRHVSPDGADVTSMGGLRVTGLTAFDPQPEDMVVLCGSTIWSSDRGAALIDALTPKLRAARGQGAALAGICGGAMALARMGVLDGVRHTGNGRDYMTHWAGSYPGHMDYVDQPHALRDQGIATASGLAPASFAAAVLREAGAEPDISGAMATYLGAEHQGSWAL